MTSRNKGKSQPTKMSWADRMTDAPARIAILCGAVLVISVSGGILIGKVFGPETQEMELQAINALANPSATAKPVVAQDIFVPESPFAYNDYPVDMRAVEVPIVTAALPIEPEAMEPEKPDPVIEALTVEKLSGEEPAWKRYAALSPPLQDKPLIAIVIDDVGLSHQQVEELNALPALLTLSFLPYAPSLQEKVEMTRREGNEIMLHLPMEPTGEDVDPGPDALLTSLDVEELRLRTIRNLDSFNGYVGVNNHMGSRFTADGKAMAIVMDIMAARGLLFLDSKTTSASTGYRLAVERGMPSVKRDIFIDHVIDDAAILRQLAKVEVIAERAGVAIAIGHPHPATIRALKQWLPEARKRGFLFVPVSAVSALTFKG
ncbi:MAG: divergent polysaccharide deacetylase family protein [Sneathiella sp.]